MVSPVITNLYMKEFEEEALLSVPFPSCGYSMWRTQRNYVPVEKSP